MSSNLHPLHLADLRKSGLSEGTINEAGFVSIPPERIAKELGNYPGIILSKIPQALQKDGFAFVKLKPQTKIPLEHDWQNKLYSFSDIQQWIDQGGNYGVQGGYSMLIIIDADSPEIDEIVKRDFPKTLTVRTPKQGHHYYYFCEGIDKKIVLKKNTANKNKNHLGEIIAKGSQVVGAGSIHPDTGTEYKIINDVEIATITRELVYSALVEFIPFEYPQKDAETETRDISIVEVLGKAGVQLRKVGCQLVCSHPVHSSTNNNNFVVHPDKNVWHCFRCNTGGGAVSLIAVLEGIIDCREAVPGALRGDKFTQVLKVAKEKYGFDVEVTDFNSLRMEPLGEGTSKGQYFVDRESYLCRWKKTNDGSVPVRLANFWARISEEIAEDNGLEIQHHYLISGHTGKRSLPSVEISAVQFANMNWLHRWGTDAIIEPGQSNRDYVRHAIQVASAETTLQRKFFTHTGWREIDGNPVYLTTGGGIGGKDVSVRLSPELSRYFLPLQPENEIEAIKTSLYFLEIAKLEITLPLLLCTYLASLTTILNPMPNFSSYIYGMTGTFKTSLAILQLAHFGNFTGIEGLSNFDDSPNSVEKRAFTLKDTLLVLDDYHPSHRRQDAQSKEHLAQRLIRAYSNRTARGRLNSDTTDKGRYTPRGFLQITGEELVTLQSTLARVLVIELEPGDIDKAKLTELQNKAHLLPHAMTSFLLWAKENMEEIKRTFPERFRLLRDRATKDGEHRKLPEQTAFLSFVAELMTDWLVLKKVLSDSEGTEFVSNAWEILKRLAETQAQRLEEENPVRRFADILSALLQREARLEPAKMHDGENIGTGDLIGYYDEQYLYLLPTPLWHLLNKYCLNEGGHFPFSSNTFYRILRSKNLITPNKNGKNTTSFRRGQEVHSVLKISMGVWLKMGLQGLHIKEMQDCIGKTCSP